VLDEIYLIDISARYGLPDIGNCRGIVVRVPAPFPGAGRKGPGRTGGLQSGTETTHCERQTARLGWTRSQGPAERAREPVPEVDVGHEVLGGAEESSVDEVLLDTGESPL
jgi:hypothetical protein